MKAKKYELPTHRLLTFCVCFFMFLLYCCKIDAQTYNYTKSGFQPWKAVSDSTTIDLPIDSVVSLEPLVPQVSRKRKKIVQSLATTTDPFSHIPTLSTLTQVKMLVRYLFPRVSLRQEG